MALYLSIETPLSCVTASKAVIILRVQIFLWHGQFVYSHSFVFILRLRGEYGSWDVYKLKVTTFGGEVWPF
jgi:hypothetical protein